MGMFTSTNPVFEMLKADHEKVKALFAQFEEANDSRTKERIVRETLHGSRGPCEGRRNAHLSRDPPRDGHARHHGRSLGRAPRSPYLDQ